MAKINIEFDTKEKTLAVSMDGKKIKDVAGVSIYNYGEGDSHIDITSVMANEEDGIYERHTICANENEVTEKIEKNDCNLTQLSDKLSKVLGVY